MDELSRGPKELIAAAMAEDDPPPIVAESGWSAMSQRLSQAESVQERSRRTPAATRARRRVLWLVPAALALAAAIAWSSMRSPNEPIDAPPSRRTKAVVPAEHDSPALDVRGTEVRRDDDPDEAAWITDAEAALGSGDAERALELLDRHALRFPIGARAEDRLAVRIRALCALGRTAEAKAEVAAVRRARPDAPALRRLRDTCVGP